MLTVAVENDPGHSSLCMVCRLDVDQIWERFILIAWETDLPFAPPQAVIQRQGGLLRLCPGHADELVILLVEAF